MASKLDPHAIQDLPASRPKYEIFVYSPSFQFVHPRVGAVAQGGVPWLDRREDFRTDVPGPVKAQTAKNAVIVPVGPTGSFVLNGHADDRIVPAVHLGLLDVTDNLVGGKIGPPEDVIRHGGGDPYLASRGSAR